MSRSNFIFLAEHSPLLAELGATAEKLYPFDPASCVLKLRLLAESLTQEVAIYVSQDQEGITVYDQWITGSGKAIGQRKLRFGANGVSNNGDGFYVVES